VYQAEKICARTARDRRADVKKAEEAIEDAKKRNEGGVPRLRAAKKTSSVAAQDPRTVQNHSAGRRAGQAGPSALAQQEGLPPARAARRKEAGDVIDAEYVDVDESRAELT